MGKMKDAVLALRQIASSEDQIKAFLKIDPAVTDFLVKHRFIFMGLITSKGYSILNRYENSNG